MGGLLRLLADTTVRSACTRGQVTLLLVDRFSGGAVGAVAAVAGVEQRSTTVDASLLQRSYVVP